MPPTLCGAAENRACYSCKLRQWVDSFPRDKLHVLQYEALTSEDAMPGVLAGFKSFLGMDQHLPSDRLPLTNWKHQRGGPDEVRADPRVPCGLLFFGGDPLLLFCEPCVPSSRVSQIGKAWSMQRYQYEFLVGMARNDTLQ